MTGVFPSLNICFLNVIYPCNTTCPIEQSDNLCQLAIAYPLFTDMSSLTRGEPVLVTVTFRKNLVFAISCRSRCKNQYCQKNDDPAMEYASARRRIGIDHPNLRIRTPCRVRCCDIWFRMPPRLAKRSFRRELHSSRHIQSDRRNTRRRCSQCRVRSTVANSSTQ